jgi:MFS transporter, DHA2 family, methylenomycin A resistance protein
MPGGIDVHRHPHSAPGSRPSRTGAPTGSRFALGAALLGFFVITLDALIVSVALPSIGRDLGGGITGLQWVVDGYTLMPAALLLSAGSISDRIGTDGGSSSSTCRSAPWR